MTDTDGLIFCISSLLIAVFSLSMAVYFPAFSCFSYMKHFDRYTVDITAGIFSLCCVASLMCVIVYAVKAFRHSRTCKVFTQLLLIIFALGTAIFGIAVFAILVLAASPSATDKEISAAEKLLTPNFDKEKELEWTQSSAPGICDIQHDLNCMMWTQKECVFEDESGNASTTIVTAPTSSTTVPATTTVVTTTMGSNTTATPAASLPVCQTCGLSKNVSMPGFPRPPTCFSAMLQCFKNGNNLDDGRQDIHKHESTVMIVLSVLMLVLALIALFKNYQRSLVEPGSFGGYEHGVAGGDYNSMT